MIRNIFRRILSVASALAIVLTAYPPVIFADDGGFCPHHPEHTADAAMSRVYRHAILFARYATRPRLRIRPSRAIRPCPR